MQATSSLGADEPPTTGPPAGLPASVPSLRRLAAALAVALLVAVVMTAAGQSRPARYQARAVVTVDQPLAVAASTDEGAVRKLQTLVLRYAGLVSTAAVVDPAAEAIGLRPEAVRRSLFAVPQASLLLLEVGARSGDAGDARRIAQAGAEAVVDLAAVEQDRAGVPDDQRFAVAIVDPAGRADRTDPGLGRSLTAGAVAGAIAFAAVLLVLYAIDVRRRRS